MRTVLSIEFDKETTLNEIEDFGIELDKLIKEHPIISAVLDVKLEVK